MKRDYPKMAVVLFAERDTKMYSAIPFHFILLAVGEVLKFNTFVNPQKLQDYVSEDESFGGIRVPMENSGFIKKVEKEKYIKNIEESGLKRNKND